MYKISYLNINARYLDMMRYNMTLRFKKTKHFFEKKAS